MEIASTPLTEVVLALRTPAMSAIILQIDVLEVAVPVRALHNVGHRREGAVEQALFIHLVHLRGGHCSNLSLENTY